MEQQVNNVINFGIGCLRALSGGYADISDRVRSSVNNLIRDGEEANGDTAVKVREMVYKATGVFRRGEKLQKKTRTA